MMRVMHTARKAGLHRDAAVAAARLFLEPMWAMSIRSVANANERGKPETIVGLAPIKMGCSSRATLDRTAHNWPLICFGGRPSG